MTGLRADGLLVDVRGKRLVGPLSVSLSQGRVVALVGPNGAGKTSLLRALAGDVAPSEGRVTLHGEPLDAWEPRALARLRAVVPQHASLTFPFEVLPLVQMGRLPHDEPTSRAQEIARAALERLGLGPLARRRYTTLSGGERQRVHLARALAQLWEAQPEGGRFLLLDEPTAHLDPAHVQEVMQVLRGLASEGVGVVLVIHDLNTAALCADELLLLRQGTLLAQGPAAQVLTPENLRALLGVAPTLVPHPEAQTPMLLPAAPSPPKPR
jgi:iron complex transport system ATP-binding protein